MSRRYEMIEDALIAAVRNGCEGKDVGVAFSGGLDSGLVASLAKRYARSVTLYTCGAVGAYDVVMAEDLAKTIGLPWVHAGLSKEDIDGHVRGIIAASGTEDPFTVSYEMPLFRVCETAGESVILSGQGADEYFMGCAKFVGTSEADYKVLRDAAVQRLLSVSVPCERTIAKSFGKALVYPYLDQDVTAGIAAVGAEELRPTDMDSRKSVLKEMASDLGFDYLLDRKKKSAQYGSGTTDLIRSAAKARGMRFNQYVAAVYDEVCGDRNGSHPAAVYARIDPIVKAEAERILESQGISVSEAVEGLYRDIIRDRGLRGRKAE